VAIDRVQVLKEESTALGGDDADATEWGPTPLDPQEDALEARGYFIQDETNRDENVMVSRSGDDMTFKDVSNPVEKTLTELLAGAGGLTEAAHRALRQLIHFIGNGPAEGFASGAFFQVTGTVFPTAEIWYVVGSTPPAGKIVELLTTWSGAQKTQEQWKMYDTDGSTVLVTVTDVISYSGVFETGRVRTIA
jgi:hypothetical protein